MATFEQQIEDNLRSLQRQVNRLATARPGPMSWGPRDGHTRFYGADGTTVLFEAVGGSGASVVSRGALTGMTPLLDSIRDTDDAQNGRLNDQHGWITSLGTRMGSAEGRIGTAEGRLDGHDGTLASHNTRISTAQSRADKGVADASAAQGTANTGVSNAATAQSRADSAYTRAGTGISNAATAQARADSAYSRAGTGISNAATAQSRADAAYTMAGNAHDNAAALRTQVRNWIEQARQDNPSLPPNIPA